MAAQNNAILKMDKKGTRSKGPVDKKLMSMQKSDR